MNNINNLSYELSEYNKNIDDTLLEKIKTLPIIDYYNQDERVVYDNLNKIYIKFINKYENNSELNNEVFITSEILNNRLKNTHLIDFYGIINIIKNKPTNYISSLIYKEYNSPETDKRLKVTKHEKEINVCGILMPEYDTLESYLDKIDCIEPKILLFNILGILDLMIYVRDKYKYVHSDIKIQNILIKDNIFYVIDWEDIRKMNDPYYSFYRPTEGNTEMYPFYDVSAEQFFIYSIGILIVRILGYKHGVTYKHFMDNKYITQILKMIPPELTKIYEDVIMKTYTKKYYKIEKLKEDINTIYDSINNG
jgi:hypothetical protein